MPAEVAASSVSGCIRGASGDATSSSTACTPRAPRSPTPASRGPTSSSSRAATRCATAIPATSRARSIAQALGWNGAQVASTYGACATGAQAIDVARARILAGLCDVALVVGADTTPKGFFAPAGGDRKTDPDWLRFRLLGATNPIYFGLYARRRMEIFGATLEDFAQVKVKNSRHGLANPNARYKKLYTLEEVMASPIVSDPLRLLDICATSDGGAAVVLTSMDFARKRAAKPVRDRGGVDGDARLPEHRDRDAELRDRLGRRRRRAGRPVPRFDRAARLRAGRHRARGRRRSPRSTTSRPRSSSTGTRTSASAKPGEAEKILRDGVTTLGGKQPVNPSGGLGCFGEAIPAQAISQLCELTWQLRGQAGERQVANAKVGVAVNQGLFGHGSAVLAKI